MLVRIFTKFDNHCIIYFALIGIALNIMFGPKFDPITSGAGFALIGGLAWYTMKAIFITGGTVANWSKDHPGEPRFKAGGVITEYDQDFAKAVGEAAAKAVAKEMKKNE